MRIIYILATHIDEIENDLVSDPNFPTLEEAKVELTTNYTDCEGLKIFKATLEEIL